jgi:hypothetical protein
LRQLLSNRHIRRVKKDTARSKPQRHAAVVMSVIKVCNVPYEPAFVVNRKPAENRTANRNFAFVKQLGSHKVTPLRESLSFKE